MKNAYSREGEAPAVPEAPYNFLGNPNWKWYDLSSKN
jgi:hypothetical protein